MYETVYRTIEAISSSLKEIDPHLADVFQNCYPNTLQTTVELLDDGTSFVITGDIPAMWLRDSSAQIRPYMEMANEDADLRRLIRGVIHRQAKFLLLDNYANAFNKEPNDQGHTGDLPPKGPGVWERKYELDSLCYPVQLCAHYWRTTGDRSVFNEDVHGMFRQIVATMLIEQHHDQQSGYSFQRFQCPPSDTLPFDGRGTRTNYTGMVWSGFRPSDDACKYGYLIPANMFAVVILRDLGQLALEMYDDADLNESALKLAAEIEFGIETYGKVQHPEFGTIYAYETDGFGNYNLMDDANVPSLLSIPYLGYRPSEDPIYRNTRAFVLSPANPSYYSGTYGRGVGSPHTPPGHIWPIGLIMQGLTSTDPQEQESLIRTLAATTADTNFMHESFHPDDPGTFTREWFAWANSLFGEFIARWVGGLTAADRTPSGSV
ncbi:glycoside hydrolase family 125 protein [Paenibacillus sacheonensis]|uniref:Glycoside hydrolase family 125 protein n=1 Tax=Paenibacillus sacheonensis TaxID=742054 RepID=A0A7X5BX53_9BACL|nr:glycoside hydrolase family 125 protein [Paenibacillus sacheonensis]MBM7565134.1 meiotically up-regulated gene 157 (Mug157) protein [Paenibacillus sacheonensis]NBC70083.1 glycoside hydrolase family 125 protein [Paenibacillus sacheonensis]